MLRRVSRGRRQHGNISTTTVRGDYKGATVGTSPAYSFGSSVCEVSVDLETGKVDIERFTDYPPVRRSWRT
jgi:CO/xanthine dehydrogenase Mo-binding subunit